MRLAIPINLGREVDHATALCSECLEVRIKVAPDELEPLCWGCAKRDEIMADLAAKHPEPLRVPVVEHQVPVEFARHDPRPFGLGFAEIPSSKLTQALAEDRRGHGDAFLALGELVGVYVLLGLVMLAVAAVS